ncbi:MAG: xylulokinase, partial [Planctomycetes bacterium]|nr:xylulokinase [Planctomycetota bacterium]
MSYLLGIDIGTSRLKTILVSEDGKIITESSVEYPIDRPHPKWAEQDPQNWWQAVKDTLAEVLLKSKINPKEIKCIGLSGQMLGAVII